MRPLKRIFCVDDDEQITQLLPIVLKKLGYVPCGVADSAPVAVAGIGESMPDLVLVDIDLNGNLDGFEIGTFLASKTAIPFLLMTARDDPAILDRVTRSFPGILLMKPFDTQSLKTAIERALQNKRLISTPVK